MIVCKLFNEPGDWTIAATGERVNLLCANSAWTPDGLNVGWTEFDSKESAIEAWDLIPYEENIENNESTQNV